MSMKILIVDDEVNLKTMIVEDLKLEGFDAVGASSVKEALQCLSQQKFDFVVSDLRMPGESGLDLLAQTKVPVLLISGFSDLTPEQAKEKGAVDLLPKPFDIEELIAILRRTSDG